MYGSERCFDPCKDLVLPSWRSFELARQLRHVSAHGRGWAGARAHTAAFTQLLALPHAALREVLSRHPRERFQ